MTYDIRNNEESSQFETTVDGSVAYSAYDLEEDGRMVFTHTVVPDALSGRGIAGELVRHGLEHAKKENLKVVPQCPYVASFIKRHPEYQELVAQT